MHHVGCMAGHESYAVHGCREFYVVHGRQKICPANFTNNF